MAEDTQSVELNWELVQQSQGQMSLEHVGNRDAGQVSNRTAVTKQQDWVQDQSYDRQAVAGGQLAHQELV